MKRHVAMLAVLLLVAAGAPAALAATHKAKTHNVTATVQEVILSSQGNPPVSGSTVNVGTAQGTLGSGAFVATTTYAAPNFSAKFKVFLAHGTIKATLTGTGTLHPDGSASTTGSGKVTGGTGTYKGSKGTFTFTGSAPASGPATLQVKGKIKY